MKGVAVKGTIVRKHRVAGVEKQNRRVPSLASRRHWEYMEEQTVLVEVTT